MNPLHVAIVAALVFLGLAIVAWASAWKAMEWLGDAEDLIERALQAPTRFDEPGTFALLRDYRRRTPRRRPA